MCNWRECFIGILLISLVLLMTPGVSPAATINIEAGKTAAINPLIYGNNLEVTARWNSTVSTGFGAWDTVNYNSVPAVVNFAQDEGITILRFPGGCLAHEYHWTDGIGPYASRPLRTYSGWNDSDNKYGTDEHMIFCEDVGADAMITVNTLTGTPEEAAAWAAYMNGSTGNYTSIGVDKNGKDWYDVNYWATLRGNPLYANHPAPFNIKYWEVGNEVWHNNYEGFTEDVVTYTKIFREFYTAIKNVDPNIKVGAVLKTWPWWKMLIEAVGDQADFVIFHYYKPFFDDGNAGSAPARDVVFKATLAAPLQTARNLTEIRNVIEGSSTVAAAGRAQDIEVLVTEFNAKFYNTVNSTVKNYQYSLGSALQQAESLNYFMNPDNKVGAANIWDFKSDVFGSVDGEGPSYTLRPNHYIYTMYRDYFGSELVNTTVTSETYDSVKVTNNAFAVASEVTDADDARFRVRLQRETGTNIEGAMWYDDIVVRESSGTNLVLNPGFETDFTGADWIYNPSDPLGVISSIDPATSRSENRSFKLSFAGGSGPAYDGIYQDIAVTPNTRYQIEGYIKTQGIKIDPINLLSNPGFESNFTSWTSSSPAGATTSIDSTVSRSGTKSARVVFSGSDVNYYHTYKSVSVDPDVSEWYLVEGYIKTQGITGTRGVCLEWDDGTNTKMSYTLVGDNDWTYVVVVRRLDPSATQLTVRLRRLSGGGAISGTAWWDDIRIQPIPKTYSPNIQVDVYNSDSSYDRTITLEGLLGTHDWVQKRTDGTPYLSARASKDTSGNLYLMVVNKNLNNPVTATINIDGFAPLSNASVSTLNGPSIDSTNEVSNNVVITPSSIINASTSFAYSFPAHSLTAIKFGREPTDINGDGFINWLDVKMLSEQWLNLGGGLSADINGDLAVDIEDFAEFAGAWQQR